MMYWPPMKTVREWAEHGRVRHVAREARRRLRWEDVLIAATIVIGGGALLALFVMASPR